MRLALLVSLTLFTACGGAPSRPIGPRPSPAALHWEEWSAEAFERARLEGKPIMLSVQAGWCHWCHVMNDTTLSEPDIVTRLERDFVLIRADGDARPDLAERFRRYAWPATVFLRADGQLILGVRGYRSAERFRAILDSVDAAHQAGTSLDDLAPAETRAPSDDLRAVASALRADLDSYYDEAGGGWGTHQRYPIAATVEHAFFRAAVRGESLWRERALFTLDQYAQLIDPVFGGIYQYSVPDVWTLPHFEKIAAVQAGALRNFAQAYEVTRDARHLDRAEQIHRYVIEFLRSPQGVFYASQDADLGGHGQDGPHVPGAVYFALDADGRRALGVPRVDTHVYASHSGMLIEALASLSIATADPTPLREASVAMEQLLQTHTDPQTRLMVHDAQPHDAQSRDPVRYLADQAYVLAALIALHQASGEARWLDRADALATAITTHLRDPSGALLANTPDPALTISPGPPSFPLAENGVTARALMSLAVLLDRDDHQQVALAALRATSDPAAIERIGRMAGEYLMALELADVGYVRFSVVGPPADPRTIALHRASLTYPDPRALVDVHAPGVGPYPYPGQPSLFVCAADACSMPMTDASAVEASVREFLRAQ